MPAGVAAALAVIAAGMPLSAAGARTIRVGQVEHAALAALSPPVAAGLRLHVAVTLRPRDPAALAAFAAAVSTPGSAVYRRYLSPARFARRFGATAGQIAAVRRALRARGLDPGQTSAGGLSIPVTATAAALERAFSISLRRISLSGRRTAVAADAAPALPADAAAHVQSIIGLDTSSAPRPLLARLRRTAGRRGRTPPAESHVVTGGPQPCPEAQAAAPRQYSYTIDEIASAYGFAGLYGTGDEGAGITIAVYELEPDDPADIAAYQACYATRAPVSYVGVDGGAGRGAGSGEAALDIENTIGLAPASRVLVYQGPNANSGAPGSGPYDIFSAIVNQDRAQVVSVSWGECEAALGQSDAIAESTLFAQAAAEGQTIVSAAGDSGAEDCDAPGAVPDTRPAVDDPASQPLVTGVGGTSLTALGPPPSESVWNNPATATSGALSAGAGGGGLSSFWAMPVAQRTAPAALGVRRAATASGGCHRASGSCRAVPDVAADANPSTGYEIYWNGTASVAGEPVGWQGIGGTSGAAPVWAAVLALADSSPACNGSPVGYADPALYRAASTDYAADFHDVAVGENDFTATNGGRYAAGPGYDLASGLGSPNGADLVRSLCADTVHLPALPARLSAARANVSVRLRAGDEAGQALRYAASGLPAGLKLDGATGMITGRPSRQGHSTVQVTVRDKAGSTASGRFTWTIGGAARLTQVTLIGASSPRLTFTVIAARNAPPIATMRIAAPRGLALRSVRGVRVTTASQPARALRFAVRLAGHALTIALRRPAARAQITLGRPALVTFGGRGALTSSVPVWLDVRMGDSALGSSRLSTRLAHG